MRVSTVHQVFALNTANPGFCTTHPLQGPPEVTPELHIQSVCPSLHTLSNVFKIYLIAQVILTQPTSLMFGWGLKLCTLSSSNRFVSSKIIYIFILKNTVVGLVLITWFQLMVRIYMIFLVTALFGFWATPCDTQGLLLSLGPGITHDGLRAGGYGVPGLEPYSALASQAPDLLLYYLSMLYMCGFFKFKCE